MPKKPTNDLQSKAETGAQLGVLLQPKNIIKTLASQVPFASAGVEMLNQLEGNAIARRLEITEQELKALQQLKAPAAPAAAPQFREWSHAASEYLTRSADLAVVYDGGFHSRADRGRVMVQVVGHGCLVGNREFVTCKEALSMVTGAAEHKYGRAIVIAGMAWYAFEAEPVDTASGICVCRLTQRDEVRWQEAVRGGKEAGMPEMCDSSDVTPVRFTITPWIGQEVGFVHAGEAKDILIRMEAFTRVQFDTSVISHFRKLREDGLKTFTTGVLGGRVLHAGSPVFSRDSVLLGILAETENYESGAGRRAVVRTLLGHPRYMKRQAAGTHGPTESGTGKEESGPRAS